MSSIYFIFFENEWLSQAKCLVQQQSSVQEGFYSSVFLEAKLNVLCSTEYFGMQNKKFSVCIVGGGPVGLIASGLLKHFKVPHAIIERRKHPTTHPQAHFFNARSMEILQAYFPHSFNQALQSMPQSTNWRYYTLSFIILC